MDFNADLLVKKILSVRSDSGDLGNIVLDYPPRRVDTGAPPANLSRPQGKWQAYDITFRNDR